MYAQGSAHRAPRFPANPATTTDRTKFKSDAAPAPTAPTGTDVATVTATDVASALGTNGLSVFLNENAAATATPCTIHADQSAPAKMDVAADHPTAS